MKKKTAIVIIALSLVLCFAVGGTLAWLITQTDPVVNTFTYGDINITLTETTGDEYKMIPGNEITKNPRVSVLADSEACWLFVEITKSSTYDTYLEKYVIVSDTEGWAKLEGTTSDVYYREVKGTDAKKGVGYPVLVGDKVKVRDTVTKEMMEDIKKGTVEEPTLTFKAYAVQKDGFDTAKAAWDEIN